MRRMRIGILVALIAACGKGDGDKPKTGNGPAPAAIVDAGAKAPPPDAAPRAQVQQFPDAAAALASIVGPEVRVLGVGELHERKGAAPVQSAIARFRGMFKQVLAQRASDLIVEVWARDTCGETSAKATAQMTQMTQRPATTENEIISLMKQAKAGGTENSVIEMHCDDYAAILDAKNKNEIDYEKLLLLVTKKLLGKALVISGNRKRNPVAGRDLVVLYGGALHNNRYPNEGIREFSYAPSLVKQYGAGYVEVDLYVPEYVDGDEMLEQEKWFPEFRKAPPDRVTVIERGPSSYILILQRGQARPPK
jgi:hypothetical protein